MDAVVRHRAAIVMGVVVVVVVLATLLGKGSRNGGGQNTAGVPRVTFGAQVRRLAATGRLTYTNGWTATTGTETIGVYAGRDAANTRNGLLVIVRQSGGHRRLTNLSVRGSGALTLLRPPPPASEQAAFATTLRFITANGGTGTLALSGDSVKLGAGGGSVRLGG